MKKILVAYLFLLIDLELAMNIGYFGAILPMVAACLLLSAFESLANENEQFEECVLYAQAMVGVRLVLALLGAVCTTEVMQQYAVLCAAVVLAAFFIMTYRMLCAFREIEQENNLFSASLFCMVGEVCLCAIAGACVWASASPTLGANFFALSFVASALFLLTLYQLQAVYSHFEKTVQ